MSTPRTYLGRGPFTRSFYQKYLVRGHNDRHYLLVGRLSLSGVVITLIGVVYAVFFIKRVLYSFLLTETMSTFVGISVVGGILWTRANRWGALASLTTAFAVNFSLYQARHERLDHWDPTLFLAALLAGCVTLVAVSIITRLESPCDLRSFYRRLQTPATGAGEPPEDPTEEPISAPSREAAKMGHQLLLPNLFQLRRAACGYGLLHAYREDLTGFVIGCLNNPAGCARLGDLLSGHAGVIPLVVLTNGLTHGRFRGNSDRKSIEGQ